MRISDSFDTTNERLEKFNSWQDHSPHFWSRGVELNPNDNVCTVKNTLPTELNDFTTPAGAGLNYKQHSWSHNLVTDVGDEYYSKKITGYVAGAAYDEAAFKSDGIAFHVISGNYGCMILRNGTVADIDGSDQLNEVAGWLSSGTANRNTTKVLTANYPRTTDPDADNTGGAVDQVTWAYSWTIGDFNTTGVTDLKGGCITDRANNSAYGTATNKLLTHFDFAASGFEKTASDTLKVFVNHTFEGAGD